MGIPAGMDCSASDGDLCSTAVSGKVSCFKGGIAGQKSLVRRIQADLKRESGKLHAANRHVAACSCEGQIDGLDCVLTSLEHLENIRNASAVLITEARDALARLPMSPNIKCPEHQEKGKRS